MKEHPKILQMSPRDLGNGEHAAAALQHSICHIRYKWRGSTRAESTGVGKKNRKQHRVLYEINYAKIHKTIKNKQEACLAGMLHVVHDYMRWHVVISIMCIILIYCTEIHTHSFL